MSSMSDTLSSSTTTSSTHHHHPHPKDRQNPLVVSYPITNTITQQQQQQHDPITASSLSATTTTGVLQFRSPPSSMNHKNSNNNNNMNGGNYYYSNGNSSIMNGNNNNKYHNNNSNNNHQYSVGTTTTTTTSNPTNIATTTTTSNTMKRNRMTTTTTTSGSGSGSSNIWKRDIVQSILFNNNKTKKSKSKSKNKKKYTIQNKLHLLLLLGTLFLCTSSITILYKHSTTLQQQQEQKNSNSNSNHHNVNHPYITTSWYGGHSSSSSSSSSSTSTKTTTFNTYSQDLLSSYHNNDNDNNGKSVSISSSTSSSSMNNNNNDETSFFSSLYSYWNSIGSSSSSSSSTRTATTIGNNNAFTGKSGVSSSSSATSSSSSSWYSSMINTNSQENIKTVQLVAERTIYFGSIKYLNDFNYNIPNHMDKNKNKKRIYPTKVWNQEDVVLLNVTTKATSITPVTTTYYERAYQTKQMAFATLSEKEEKENGTNDNNNTSSSTSSSSSMLYPIDAPLHCLRMNYQNVTSNNNNNNKPTIAIITSTQSTKNMTATVDTSLLYKHLIRSIISTISSIEVQYWTIVVYIAIDHTDTWWIQKFYELNNMNIPTWLSINMCIYPKNRLHHIPFNEIALTAYHETYADYYVRVNDDTEFKTIQWITIGANALQGYDPPNIGVVGPSCIQGNTAIMTHDMVHRTHIHIFHGYYYPASFNNWYLDDWISNVYSSTILGNQFHRSTVIKSWSIKHWMYDTRYIPDTTDAQWLPIEYERGRYYIQQYIYTNYPNHTITKNNLIANTLPLPQRYDIQTIQDIVQVLPRDNTNTMLKGNILIWGLNLDSHYWHRLTSGYVVFLEDKSLTKKFERYGIWRDYIMKLYPYLQYFPIGYTTIRDHILYNYDTYVSGQNHYNQYNWCDLQIPQFPQVIYNTTWDIIIVNAPERCTTRDSCTDDDGPSILQALYMTQMIIINQLQRTTTTTNKVQKPIHVYIDNYDRRMEHEFTSRLFMTASNNNNNKQPSQILQRRVNTKVNVSVAHYTFHSDDSNNDSSMDIPQCDPPLLRDYDYYPKNADIVQSVVQSIVENLPKMGNMLIWGIGPDCIFWHRSTYGRVIFLIDINQEQMELKSSPEGTVTKKVKHIDYYKQLYPELEIYEVVYTSTTDVKYVNQFFRQPDKWSKLAMNDNVHRLPNVVHEIIWDVILVDGPAGFGTSSPGRLQSLYMSKILADNSIKNKLILQQLKHVEGKSIPQTTASVQIYVDDYDRAIEKEYSGQFYGKQPIKIFRRGKTSSYCAQYTISSNDNKSLSTITVPKQDHLSYDTKRDMVSLKALFEEQNDKNMISWVQMVEILKVLPLDGNLLIWGESDISSTFWNSASSGTLVILSDGVGKVNSEGSSVYKYKVNYTSVDSKETYKKYFGRPELWYDFEMKDEFSSVVLNTKWDVIFVDGPAKTTNGPGKYQSMFMSMVFIKRVAAMILREERMKAKDVKSLSHANENNTVQVFVDDFHKPTEREYSRHMFGRDPISVYENIDPALKFARFVFGPNFNTVNPLFNNNKYMSNVIRSQYAVPKETQMGWDQIRTILGNLPEDGNLLVWGLGNDSLFWSRTTTGKVMFLEDGSFGTNLVNGKRWFDLITEKYPALEAYTVDYTTTNTETTYARFMNDPGAWKKELDISKKFPLAVLETRWDVILVDAPLGYPGSGPGRYQSLFMSRVLAERNELINGTITHVFVDDYERKVEREFSQRVFERNPVEVVSRKKSLNGPANEQAHFMFGAMNSTQYEYKQTDDVPSKLVPWTYPSQLDISGALHSYIILVEVNDGYYDFFLNWLYHYEELKIGIDVLVIAEDDVVRKKLEYEVCPQRPHVRVERTTNSFMASSLSYGTAHYKKLVSGRATHILSKLKAGKNVIYTDVDTVWTSNPLLYLGALGNSADAVLLVDTEKYEGYSPYYCTGFMAFISNSRTVALISAWEYALKTPQLNQPIFNKILHKLSSVRHQPLPSMEFPSGMMYFSKMNPTQRQNVVVVHNNYVQGIQNKQVRFEQRGLWKLKNRITSINDAAPSSWFKLF